MLSLDTIYIYRVGHREFEIIPNYEGSDKEFFHILERVPKEGKYSFYEGYRLYYYPMIATHRNEHNLNTLEDAKDFIHNYIKANKEGLWHLMNYKN